MTALKALILVCTLKRSPAESSSDLLARQMSASFDKLGIAAEVLRVVDHAVHFGVSTDEGNGDAWPVLREKMLAANILALVTPIWLGQTASVCKVVLERLDAELSETDDEGRLLTYGKVGLVGAVGNEDGAHHVISECLQALNDTGFSIAASAGTYWVGEAMQATDYKDLDPSPETTTSALATTVANAAHLAALLEAEQYPAS